MRRIHQPLWLVLYASVPSCHSRICWFQKSSSSVKSALNLNKKLMVELLNAVHPSTNLPDGAFERLLESEFFGQYPVMLLPMASVSTLGFRVFEERETDARLIEKYQDLIILENRDTRDAIEYRGSGIFHDAFVGRRDYRRCGEAIGVDLENNPSLARTRWDVMVKIADWQLEEAIIHHGKHGAESISMAMGLKNLDYLKLRTRNGIRTITLFQDWIGLWLQQR